MRTLQHDNVIAFKDIYTTVKQKLCIVMEYAENGDLDKRIEEQAKSGKHFEEKTVLTWFAQIIAGLAYIHSKYRLRSIIGRSSIGTSKGQTYSSARMMSARSVTLGSPSIATKQ